MGYPGRAGWSVTRFAMQAKIRSPISYETSPEALLRWEIVCRVWRKAPSPQSFGSILTLQKRNNTQYSVPSTKLHSACAVKEILHEWVS